MQRRHAPFFPTLVALLLCLGRLPAASAEGLLEVSLAGIETAAWSANGIRLSLDPLTTGAYSLRLRIATLRLPGDMDLRDLTIHCPAGRVDAQRLSCAQASLRLLGANGQQLSASLALDYQRHTRELQFRLHGLRPFPGKLSLQGRWRDQGWSVSLHGKGLDLAALQAWLLPFMPGLAGFSDVSGELGLEVAAEGHDSIPTQARLRLDIADVAFNGVNAAEGLGGQLQLDYQRRSQHRLQVDMQLSQGGLYIEPGLQLGGYRPGFTFEIGAHPLHLAGQVQAPLDVAIGQGRVQLQDVRLSDPGVMDLQLSGLLAMQPGAGIEALELHLERADLGKLYPRYLQPLLLHTGLSELETAGAAGLDMVLDRDGLRQARLSLADVYLDDAGGRFRVSGLAGVWAFTSEDEPVESMLHWDGAGIYRLDIGATDLAMVSHAGRLELAAPGDIPILDGRLQVARLRLQGLARGDTDILIDGELSPVSLQELTQALGWPLMSGKLSGQVPGVHYHRGDLEVNGRLEIEAFDGRISIRNLRVADLFGRVPVLDADLDIHGLDLDLLTRTFSFGGISGRLDGAIKGLRLEAWEPLRFDAWLATPKDDDSRHRISQRAVDNLTRIGGGATTSAISRTFLGVFKTFGYDRLGLRCRLQNGVCQMDGVAPAESGYYIVEHGLLPPWLDIIGYNRSVNWEVLVARLRGIVQGQVPVLE